MKKSSENTAKLSIDTLIVLFFLALEIGQSSQIIAVDTLLMSITLVMILVLPYFLIQDREPPVFGQWLARRGVVALIGLILGFGLGQSVGTLLPPALGFVPMTLLIIAAMISCYVQIYGLMKLRLAK